MKFVALLIMILGIGGVLADTPKKIVIIGDSLTEGYGVDKESAYPFLLGKILEEKGHNYKVINGGVSGSTTSSGISRLKWFLKAKPEIIILALGANDGLRGIKVEMSKKNLEEVIVKCQKNDVKVVLAGMQLPPNYGEDYTKDFKKMYSDLIQKYKLASIPFLIEGVAGVPELNIEDGIHPNEKGHKILAQTVYKHLKDQL